MAVEMVDMWTSFVSNDVFVWLFKVEVSNNEEDDESGVTTAEEKISTAGTKESVFVQDPGGLLQTSMRSGSPQLQQPPPPSPHEPVTSSPREPVTSSPHEPVISDNARCPESDVSKSPQTLAYVSHFTDEAWFQEVFTDYVRTSC